jgi:hypothetical protein
MPQIPLDCPYCQTKRAAFHGNYPVPFKPGDTNNFIMLMQCQICGHGIVAKFYSSNGHQFSQWVQGQVGMAGNATLEQTFPKPVAAAAPGHTPENVGRFYLQGMDNIARNFDAAGTMFRKSLDAALKHLDPTGKGTLEKRIDNLPAATGVTPAMKDWAQQIRHLGNDAAHEDDPFTEAEAKSLQAFTELFLTYAFTLPGMLAARKPPAPASSTT